MAGPTANLKKGWDLIKTKIKLDEPTDMGRFLGCEHKRVTRTSPLTGKKVSAIEYDMSEFLDACVEVYCKEFQVDRSTLSKKKVNTPFLSGKERGDGAK